MRSLYVQMIFSFGWSPEIGIFLGFLVFIFQLISGTLLYVNSQQRCVRVLALPLHTDYYLRKLDSYKQQLTLFSIDILSIVPGKKDLEFHNQEIVVLRRDEVKLFFFLFLLSFLFTQLPCPLLKGCMPVPLPPYPFNSKTYFRSHLPLTTFPNISPYWSFPSLYSNSNYIPIGDI